MAMGADVRSASLQQELPLGVGGRRKKRGVSGELKVSLLGGVALLLGLLFYVWQHIQVVRLGYQIERLRVTQGTLVQERNALGVEIGQLRSLKRIEDLARRKLGMVYPAPEQIILLPDPPEGG
jgi:cell division protein FtsL